MTSVTWHVACHSERSEAESKNPVAKPVGHVPRSLDPASEAGLGMTTLVFNNLVP